MSLVLVVPCSVKLAGRAQFGVRRSLTESTLSFFVRFSAAAGGGGVLQVVLVHPFTHTYISYIYIYICMYIYICHVLHIVVTMHTDIYSRIHTYKHTYVRTYVHTYTSYTCIHTYIHCIYLFLYMVPPPGRNPTSFHDALSPSLYVYI